MKNEYSKDRSTYFLMPRIHGNVLAWNKPASTSKLERSKQATATETIQRWEDDGGPVSEKGTPLSQVMEINTPRPMDAGTRTD